MTREFRRTFFVIVGDVFFTLLLGVRTMYVYVRICAYMCVCACYVRTFACVSACIMCARTRIHVHVLCDDCRECFVMVL